MTSTHPNLSAAPAPGLDWDGAAHTIRFTARHARAALDALNYAAGSGLELRQLGLKPVGDRVEAWVFVEASPAAAAERLADRIAALAGVEWVNVEHLWGRR
jgi:hypothetical protein